LSKIKVTYVQGTGRGEPIRLAFHIGGIEFEDERIDFEELKKRKPHLPYGSLPVLTLHDGEIIAQSNTILRYVGRLTKLYPEDNLQATRVDELIDAMEDASSKMAPVIYDQNPETKKIGLEKVNSEIFPHWTNLIEKRIEKYGKGYAVGEHLTIIDLKIYQFFGSILHQSNTYVQGISIEPIKNAPKLHELLKKVAEHPKIAEWNKSHNQI